MVKGDNRGFLGISKEKIISAIIKTHNTSWGEEKSVNCIAQRRQSFCSLFQVFHTDLIERN
jgi:hypothetical protein